MNQPVNLEPVKLKPVGEQVVHHCAADRDRRLQPLRSRHEWDTIAERMARLLDRITRTRVAAGSASA